MTILLKLLPGAIFSCVQPFPLVVVDWLRRRRSSKRVNTRSCNTRQDEANFQRNFVILHCVCGCACLAIVVMRVHEKGYSALCACLAIVVMRVHEHGYSFRYCYTAVSALPNNM